MKTAEPMKAEPVETVKAENDTWISPEIQSICEDAGATFGICPELLEAIIESESSGQANVSNGECIGLMQVNYRYHMKRAMALGFTNLWDERANVFTGASLLQSLCDTYGDIGTALMAYNGTKDAASRTTLTPYAEKILNRSMELEQIHGKE